MKKVFCTILAAIMLLSLCSCGETEKAEGAVNSFFTALQKNDVKTAASFLESQGSDQNLDTEKIDPALKDYNIYSKLSYKIVSSKIDDNDKSIVNVTTEITNIDLKEIFTQYMKEILPQAMAAAFSGETVDENKYIALFKEKYEAASPKMINTTNVIRVKNINGEYKIVQDTAFYDAITGGLATAAQEMNRTMTQQ